MRALVIVLSAAGLLGQVACGASNNVTTDDSSEIDEGRGQLERDLDPPMPAPASPLIGASIADVYAKAVGNLTPGTPKKQGDDCTLTEVRGAAKTVVVQREVCTSSDTVRLLAPDGTVTSEHVDANKDGKVDRYTGQDGAVSQYEDTNCDGKIDVIVERVDKLTDFSLNGYGETFPEADFLFRIREDRDRDGKLDHEKLTAKGALPPASN